MNKLNIYDNYYSWWKTIDKTILIFVISFFLAGLFFSLASTSLIASDRLNTNSYYFFIKHFIYILLGLLIMFTFSLFKETFLIKISTILNPLAFVRGFFFAIGKFYNHYKIYHKPLIINQLKQLQVLTSDYKRK